jgi:hypothetical protein
MFNNLPNFLNLIVNRKIKTAATIEDTDLIPLGTKDPNFLGGYQPTAITYQELVDSLPVDGVASISDNGTGVVTVDNTDPENPVIDFNGVNVDGVTITGDGTTGSPLTAVLPPLGVQSVTDDGSGVINVDNTDPLNPVVEYTGVFVDNVSITGSGTLADPLEASGSSSYPSVQVVLFADLATTERLKPCTYNNGTLGVGATLTGNANGQLSTVSFTDRIDNVVTALNQNILVWNQQDQKQNGLYVVTQLGSSTQPFILTRSIEADEQTEMYPLQVNIYNGATLANRAFLQKTIDPVIGTNIIVFTSSAIGIQTSNLNFVDTVTSVPLPSCTYTSGTNLSVPGIGARLTATANGSIGTINGIALFVNNRILVKDEVNQAHNGDYTVTQVGSASTPFILTRVSAWGGEFPRLVREWKVNNPTSTKYGARYSTNLTGLPNISVGVTAIPFFEVTSGGYTTVEDEGTALLQRSTINFVGAGVTATDSGSKTVVTIPGGGLPSWVETDATDLTIWCNGKGNIATNTGFGENTLQAITTGSQNTAFGRDALSSVQDGVVNTAIGYQSLKNLTIGSANIAIGRNALLNNSSGSNHIAIGDNALGNTTSVNSVIGIGASAFQNINGGLGGDIAIGNGAGNALTSSFSSVLIGNGAGGSTSLTFGATLVGDAVCSLASVTLNASAFGYRSQANLTTGSENTSFGYRALTNTNIGNGNVAVGHDALSANTTGSNNTAVGSGTISGNFGGSIILGKDAAATGNNQFVVGSSGTNAGTITTETIVPSSTWTVRINGANYKIPLLPV